MIQRQSDDRLQSKSGRLPIYLNVRCNALVSWLTTKPHCVGVDLSHGSSPRLLLCGSGRIKHFSGKNPRTPLSHPSTPPHSPYFPDPPLKASTSTKGYKDEVQQPTKSTSLPKNGEKS